MPLKPLAALILACSTALAHAGVITFENQGVPGAVSNPGFTADGYQFSENTDVADVSPDSVFGFGTDGGHSGLYAGFNDFGGPVVMSRVNGGAFSVSSLWLHGFFGIGGAAMIQGFSNNVLQHTMAATFGETWNQIALNFTGIDTLVIDTTDLFYVDDISVTNVDDPNSVPEPGSLALLGLAAAAGALSRRVRR